MPWYTVTLKQIQPVEVWADTGDEEWDRRRALERAIDESEWDDDYEIIEGD